MSAAENLNSLRLQQTLASCSQSIANGDHKQSEESISELVRFLDSVSDFISSGTKDEEESENTAFEVLSEIYHYLISPSLDQAVTDALAFEIPAAVAKLACVSTRCFENAEKVINHFVEICNPRDMVSILCDAMSSPSENFKNSFYFTPILGAVAKAIEALKRKPFEQVKAALPVVLNVLEVILKDSDSEDTASMDFLNKAVSIANSINKICIKSDYKDEKLLALFGLYVLQITVLISNSVGSETSKWSPIMLQLSQFLHYCGFTYLGLITGHEVNTAVHLISQGDEDDYTRCFSYVKCGAAITVLWRGVSDEVSEDLDEVKVKLCKSQTKRWEAVGILKHVFASYNLPWTLKKHAIDFLYCIMSNIEIESHKDYYESLDYSVYMPSLYAALQGIQMVMVYASDPLLRKKAFDTFKMVVADIPGSLRFDILMALVRNSDLSSMIAILLDCVKQEMFKEYPKKREENKVSQSRLSFWTVNALDFVEFVLKPPQGGPPSLPEFMDAVLSALNLYRFILITESSGKTNYTEVLLKKKLEKVCKEWLEPLRTLVSVVAKADNEELVTCGLNPIEFVLYRCIELVEENLKHAT